MDEISLIEDEIESIEYFGEVDTIDITVKDTHMFFGNNIYTHNSGFDTEFIEAHHTGGNIKRVQKAHFFMSVGKTPDQKEAGLANIRIIKARFAKDGQTFTDCIFDNDKMEIVIRDDDNKYTKLSKGLKHHDEKDIAKLESKANKLNEMSSDIRMHEAISRANSDSILGNLLTSYTKEFGEENKFVNILQVDEEFFIDSIKTDNAEEEINKLLQNPLNKSFELEIESEEIQQEKVIFDEFVEKIGELSNNTQFVPFKAVLPRYSSEILSINEVENNLIDPDETPSEHIGIHEMLKKARSNQGIIKKE